MGALQKPELSSCRSFGFSPAPGLTRSWQAGGHGVREGWGEWSEGVKWLAALFSHPDDLPSPLLLFPLTGGQQTASNVCVFCRPKVTSGFWSRAEAAVEHHYVSLFTPHGGRGGINAAVSYSESIPFQMLNKQNQKNPQSQASPL